MLVTHPPFSQLGNVDRNILRSTPGYLTHRTYCIETANFIRRMLIIDAVNKFKHNKGIFFSSQRRTFLSTANSVMTVLLRAIARESPVDIFVLSSTNISQLNLNFGIFQCHTFLYFQSRKNSTIINKWSSLDKLKSLIIIVLLLIFT